ncbi:DUF2510 domain-containing protein [Agromyces tardus]|jgi:hypothetical protein|uniref:DUF2510 domain-containing protein n=1 Tax=Agromyces tardus TaxID=2583849 RepID=A0A3M8AFT4_9MICO|nr:DUF2510 domain-containing protein [Agromyces tardus]RNB50019.1 DUF2510 domain-containing protein [Agromyces tardus]
MTNPTNAPAGWYDDGQGAQRYWDGTQWTEHTAPLAASAAAAAEPVAAAPVAPVAPTAAMPYAAVSPGGSVPPPPAKTNVLGIVALAVAGVGFILAVIPFTFFVGAVLLPIALILAIIALFLPGRKWPAITALILAIVGGIVGTIVFVVVIVAGPVQQALEDEGIIGSTSEATEPPAASESEEATPEPGPVGNLAFGDTMVWEDDVELTVSAPEPYTPTEFAAGADQASQLAFTMTITNNSTENLQPVVYTRLSSGGQEASQIFDVTADGTQIGVPPTTVVLPGESVTWTEAWSVADPNSLTMQIAPSFDYEDAIFTNVQ